VEGDLPPPDGDHRDKAGDDVESGHSARTPCVRDHTYSAVRSFRACSSEFLAGIHLRAVKCRLYGVAEPGPGTPEGVPSGFIPYFLNSACRSTSWAALVRAWTLVIHALWAARPAAIVGKEERPVGSKAAAAPMAPCVAPKAIASASACFSTAAIAVPGALT
jgi:hypothetical protein